jgi:hypothetical protein
MINSDEIGILFVRFAFSGPLSAPCGLEALVRPKCLVQGCYARMPHDQAGAEATGALRKPHMNNSKHLFKYVSIKYEKYQFLNLNKTTKVLNVLYMDMH